MPCQRDANTHTRTSRSLTLNRRLDRTRLRLAASRQSDGGIAVGDAVALVDLQIVAEVVDLRVEAVELLESGAEALLMGNVEQAQADLSRRDVVIERASLLNGVCSLRTVKQHVPIVSIKQE